MTEERRLVTILFADVAGSTALSESLDPEDLRALLRRYYELARDVVDEHGGTLEKFIGDAVMAVFGLPQAHGDDAARAVAAALALRDAVRGDERLGERLPIRLGVATGEVVATRDAAPGGDFLITGEAVNLAARLQQAADAWTIVADERTATAAGSAFAFGVGAPASVRGRSESVRARTVEGRATAPRQRTPFLGREADLAQLELLVRRAFGERRPYLVSLVAPAGTGKTRLLEEFVSRLPRVAAEPRIALAQCMPYGQRLTYWPLRAVLFELVGLPEDAPPGNIRRATERWLRGLAAPDPERTAALLAASVGAADVEGNDAVAVSEAWRSAIEIAARDGSLVVIFEDLHWSSDALLDLVEFLLQPRGDLPLLLVVLSRPELLDRRPMWGGGRRNYLSLVLDPLPDDLVAQLVGSLLEGAPEELTEAVVRRAAGNPFYAGELVRALVDRIGPDLRPEAVEQALGRLPDTVQAAVLARLDLLPPAARAVLQVGSVFGREFSRAGVESAEPALAHDAAEGCTALVERDLVVPTGSSLTFRHILIRDVAYATLPRAERARLHDAAGRWLEAIAGAGEEAYAELIAYHAREAATIAGTLDLPDRTVLAERALEWLTRAGDAAMAAGANVEALNHYRAAATFASGRALLEVLLRIGGTRTTGRVGVEAYEQALGLFDAPGVTPALRLTVLAQLLELHTRQQGSVPVRPSTARLEQLFAEARALAADPAAGDAARAWLGVAEGFRPFWHRSQPGSVVTADDYLRARDAAQGALTAARRLDHPRLISAALDALGSLLQDEGDFRGSNLVADERIAIQDRLPLDERLDAHAVHVWNCAMLADFDGAERWAVAALGFVRPGQSPGWVLHLRAWQAYARLLAGSWDGVIETMERGRELWVMLGRPAAGYAIRGFAAALDVAIARGDAGGREEWRAIVSEIADQFDGSTPVQRLRQAYGRLDLDAIDRELRGVSVWSASPDMVERAVSRLSDAGHTKRPDHLGRILEDPVTAQAPVLRGQLRRALGLGRDDPDLLRSALETFDGVRAVPAAARVRCELGRLVGDPGLLSTGLGALDALGDVERVAAYRSERP